MADLGTPGEMNARARIAFGFLAGATAVFVFHQGMLAVLHALDLAPRAPFSMRPTPPFGVPQLWSASFWGGVWGIVLALLLARLAPRRWLLAGLAFGTLAPTLVAWFVVAPLKGLPVAAGWRPSGMLIGVLVNGAWGLGTALLLSLLRGRGGDARGAEIA